MVDLWREWVTENPFLRLHLRRRGRQGDDGIIVFTSVTFPALLLGTGHVVYLLGPAEWHSGGGRLLGLILFSLVAAVHVIGTGLYAATVFSLDQEGTTERIDFLRLIPMGPRELLAKIGVARAALIARAALYALPVYSAILAYGWISIQDVVGFYLLYLGLVLSPPGVPEVILARTARLRAAHPPTLMPAFLTGCVWFCLFQALAQSALRSLYQRLFDSLRDRITALVGPQFSLVLPLTVLAVAARLLWEPQPFYHWMPSPAWAMAALWLALRARRLVGAAELWAREPVLQTQIGGRVAVLLPESTGRLHEQRVSEWSGSLLGALLLLIAAGYLWQPAVLTGRLGSLIGSTTPAGGVAALLVVFIGAAILGYSGRLLLAEESASRAGRREATVRLAFRTGVYGAALLGACVVGGVAPWPEPVLALPGLASAVAATLVFGLGWRTLKAGWSQLAGTQPLTSLATWADTIVPLVVYAGPILALSLAGGSVFWHLVAASSPVYAVLRLLPGLWRVGPPVPLWASLAMPLAVGAVLTAAGWLRAPGRAVAHEPRVRRDRLEQLFQRLAARWDNPIFTLETHRQQRRPLGLTVRIVWGSVLALLLPLAFLAVPVVMVVLQRQRSLIRVLGRLWQVLGRPIAGLGITVGGALGLLFAGSILLLAAKSLGWALSQRTQQEVAIARTQGRLRFLLISPLTDRQIVLGILAAGAAAGSATAMAGVAISFLSCLFALACGSSWWWMGAWVWAVLTAALMVLRSGLGTITWVLRPLGCRPMLNAALIPLLLIPLLLIAGQTVLITGAVWGWIAPVWLIAPGLIVTVLLLVTLPGAFRAAVEAVSQSRKRDIPEQ